MTVVFPFQINPKDLDPSYIKMALDIWNCFRGEKLISEQKFMTYLDILGHSRNGKAPSYKQRNLVIENILQFCNCSL